MAREKTILEQMRLRGIVVYLLLVAVFVTVVGQMVYIQVGEGKRWREHDLRNSFRVKTVVPTRGDILARDGRLLATSIPSYRIYMDMGGDAFARDLFPQKVDSLAGQLAALFGDRTPRQYRQMLMEGFQARSRYWLVKRNVTYPELKRMRQFAVFNLGKYRGGLIAESQNKRIYPFGPLARRTIGYTNLSRADRQAAGAGIEHSQDSILAGVPGKIQERRVTGGAWVPTGDPSDVEPVPGTDIVTTIDINIQDVAHEALLKTLERHRAKRGVAILMEVKTGEILAMCNLNRTQSGGYAEDYNYAVSETNEPGSTIKLASYMIALEDGYIDPDDKVETGDGRLKVHGFTIEDSHKGGFGTLTVRQAFELSSNVAVSKIIGKCYRNREKEYIEKLYRYHLNTPCGVDLRGEPSPYINYPGDDTWSGVSLMQMSYGYEMKLTPLQILNFYNAVANDGVMVRPRLVKAYYRHGKLVSRTEVEVVDRQIASPRVIRQAKEMLCGVVENGTAKNLSQQAFRIAGKTGTAQLANTRHGYLHGNQVRYMASFVGYFPADDPKYSCIVLVTDPASGQYYGNTVAGPVFREIADKVYATRPDMAPPLTAAMADPAEAVPYTFSGYKPDLQASLGLFAIPARDLSDPRNEWVATRRTGTGVELRDRLAQPQRVPNVVGMGARDAVALCENAGLMVDLRGRGMVTRQSIPPGGEARRGDRVTLTLSNNF